MFVDRSRFGDEFNVAVSQIVAFSLKNLIEYKTPVRYWFLRNRCFVIYRGHVGRFDRI